MWSHSATHCTSKLVKGGKPYSFQLLGSLTQRLLCSIIIFSSFWSVSFSLLASFKNTLGASVVSTLLLGHGYLTRDGAQCSGARSA